MTLAVYFFLTALLFVAELTYLRVARRLGLFDKPNRRSAHKEVTIIRGGGILFYLAVLGPLLINKLDQLYFLVGLTLVVLISFWDDLYAVLIRYRLSTQFAAVGLLIIQTGYCSDSWWLIVGLLIVSVGILNAYNFMDGINGMTALYSLVTVGTLWYWQVWQSYTKNDLVLPCVFIALLVFSYFNVRTQAICFAGDVGSISIGFISLYFLIAVINRYQTYLPILLLSVYGVDTVLTILYRLYLGQNILQAHRLHLFQRLVHRLGWPHLRVSALYALMQLAINAVVLKAMCWSPTAQWLMAWVVLSNLSLLYIVATKRLMNQ